LDDDLWYMRMTALRASGGHLIRSVLEDQASEAMHVDVGTKDYWYARA